MRRIEDAKIVDNIKISATNIYRMTIANIKDDIVPGQFVNVTVPGVLLPRPISVADYKNDELSLIYRVVGSGTETMSQMNKGDKLTLLTGLGNGFDLNAQTNRPLVIGGGMGAAPLFYLIKGLKKKGKNPKVLLGFKNGEDEFYRGQFKRITDNIEVSYDDDGELVTNLLENLDESDYDYFYACGPKPMLKAVSDISLTDGELSLESRMACGIGMCKCCSIETNDGMKTLCKDGPVLKKGTIRW